MDGVFLDTAQIAYQVWLFYSGLTSESATVTLHLFTSDDTPTAGTDTNTLTEYASTTYAPLVVNNGYLQSVLTPPPEHFIVDDAVFSLGTPSIGNDTIFGWWLDTPLPNASVVGLWAGRFVTPIHVPHTGGTLTFDAIHMYLNNCSPAVVSVPLLLDYFSAANGTAITSHAADVGGTWSALLGSLTIQNHNTLSHGHAIINNAVLDAGAADGIIRTAIIPGSNSTGATFRAVDANNFWWCEVNVFSQVMELVEWNAGTLTVRDSVSLSLVATSTYLLECTLNADTITCVLSGHATVSYTPATFQQTATKHGVWIYNDAGGQHGFFEMFTF